MNCSSDFELRAEEYIRHIGLEDVLTVKQHKDLVIHFSKALFEAYKAGRQHFTKEQFYEVRRYPR